MKIKTNEQKLKGGKRIMSKTLIRASIAIGLMIIASLSIIYGALAYGIDGAGIGADAINPSRVSTKAIEPKKVQLSADESLTSTDDIELEDADISDLPRETTKEIINSAFFIGKGFALSPDNSQGKLVSIKVLKQEKRIIGKMNFNGAIYKLTGEITKGKLEEKYNIDLSLTDVQGNEKGKLEGDILKFQDFLLLRGKISFSDKEPNEWDLTAFAKRKIKTVVVTKDKSAIETIASTEVVKITKDADSEISEKESAQTDAIYVKPNLKKATIFGIPIPFVKEQVELEIVRGDEVIKKTVKSYEKVRVNEYEISVGSLEDKENIEINIKKV